MQLSYDARLDMRMDQSQDLDAYQLVNTLSQKELAEFSLCLINSARSQLGLKPWV